PSPSTLFPYTTLFRSSPFVTYGLAALVLAYAAWSSRDNVAALRTARILAVLSIAAAAWSEDSTRWAFLGSGVLLMLFFAVSQARSEEHTSELQSRENL